jgi:origin recognition complex subunit 1
MGIQDRARSNPASGYLEGTGVTREDSDDELGNEDHPWQWIYQDEQQPQETVDGRSYSLSLDEEATSLPTGKSKKRSRQDEHDSTSMDNVIGARMGSFECKIGDCVLLKAEGNNEAWVGLICEFVMDEEEGLMANFMWFSTEKEIRNKAKKRKDFMQVS